MRYMYYDSPRTAYRSLMMALIVAVLLFVVLGFVGYTAGWFNFHRTPNATTIEVRTDEVAHDAKDAARNVAHEGEKLVHEAGKALENAGQAIQDGQNNKIEPKR